MNVSLDESLRKLRTHYVDIFYVHQWDFTASVEEVMNGLINLVVSCKVLYLVCVSVWLGVASDHVANVAFMCTRAFQIHQRG